MALKNKKIYWALIGTFIALYLAVAFVSTLHAIKFFQLANTLGLAILLGAAYEIGQASVLFSILMTENKNRMLAWGMMFLLTALQVTANVYASFRFMDMSGTEDWKFWQRAILFGVQAENDEMYKVIISWISGALLPLVALGMTALVADNIKLATGQTEEEKIDNLEDIIENEVKRRLEETPISEEGEIDERILKKMEDLNKAQEDLISGKIPPLKTSSTVINKEKSINLQDQPDNLLFDLEDEEKIPTSTEMVGQTLSEEINEEEGIKPELEGLLDIQDELAKEEPLKAKIEEVSERVIPSVPKEDREKLNLGLDEKIKPVNKQNGWHFMKEFVDDEHNVFHKGKYIENDPAKTPTSKKA
jgi:hypothetical protein